MGAKQAKLQRYFIDSIQRNSDGEVNDYLKKHPELASAPLYNGKTNPICRATCCGFRNIVMLLLEHGADVGERSDDGRTPLMWAAIMNNVQMVDFLLEKGAKVTDVDTKDFNALDNAAIRMNYRTAYHLYHGGHGLEFKSAEEYQKQMVRPDFDYDLFFMLIKAGERDDVPMDEFFQRAR